MEKLSKHATSNLITEVENKKITDLIDNQNGIVLCTSIIELWLSDKPYHMTWSKYDTGVLCLVKDLKNESYYFRLYNLNANLLWETEIYLEIIYQKINENFYCFPALDCNAGFNFAFTEEAKNLDNAVSKILYKSFNRSPHIISALVNSSIINNNKKATTIDKKNKKFTKDSIGVPINFVHLNHVGRSKDSFDFQSKDDKNQILLKIKQLLFDLNLKPSKTAVEVVDKIIQNNGGYLEFQKIYEKKRNVPTDNVGSIAPPLKPPPPLPLVESVEPPRPVPLIQPMAPPRSVPPIELPRPVPLIQPMEPPRPPMPSTKPIDLMEEIRKGKELKSNIINSDSKNGQIITETKTDMIDQIKYALDKMRPFIAEDEEINDSYQLWE